MRAAPSAVQAGLGGADGGGLLQRLPREIVDVAEFWSGYCGGGGGSRHGDGGRRARGCDIMRCLGQGRRDFLGGLIWVVRSEYKPWD